MLLRNALAWTHPGSLTTACGAGAGHVICIPQCRAPAHPAGPLEDSSAPRKEERGSAPGDARGNNSNVKTQDPFQREKQKDKEVGNRKEKIMRG